MKKAIILALTLALVFSFAACDPAQSPDDTQETGGTTTPAQTSEPQGTQEPRPEVTKTVGDENITLAMYETAVFENVKITADGVETNAGSGENVPAEGHVYVGVVFTVENISEEPVMISSVVHFEAYAGEERIPYSNAASIAFDGADFSSDIAPGEKKTAYFAVELPETAEELEVRFSPIWLGEIKAVFELDIP